MSSDVFSANGIVPEGQAKSRESGENINRVIANIRAYSEHPRVCDLHLSKLYIKYFNFKIDLARFSDTKISRFLGEGAP